ncbi:hypothetical protein EVAR_64010_1 [Eumeta japonica]|uniref:Uncharacterized protein n=1 Tax=Eumeta variegata TaxID=151549 RepID=A0A4C1Z2R6_EUMVA|nr:hypothetical protein EVAR_64010_1 [Eumeta japonica]
MDIAMNLRNNQEILRPFEVFWRPLSLDTQNSHRSIASLCVASRRGGRGHGDAADLSTTADRRRRVNSGTTTAGFSMPKVGAARVTKWRFYLAVDHSQVDQTISWREEFTDFYRSAET